MDNLTDQELLRDYADHRSEAAFAELVRRHIDFVYSAALRMVCDAHLAQDVAQGVFVALAQNAARLINHPVLSGWLHRTAQNLAANTVRANVRRTVREQEAVAMNELLSPQTEAPWEHIAPCLDAALGELSEPDRDAVLLRYFERKSAHEMAQILSTSDDAAQKRVSRAVERLRELFAKRGVTVGAGGLVVVISANAVQAAPGGLAAAISSAVAVAGIAVQTSTVITAAKAIAMTTLQKTLVAAALAAAFGTAIYEARQATQLRGEIAALQQQSALNEQLQRERDAATNCVALLADELQHSKSNSLELLKLRAEAGHLRENAQDFDPTMLAMKKWAANVALLKQKLEQMPNRKIPELKFATEKNWADAAFGADLSTDDGVRQALSKLREDAINRFLNEMMKAAFKKYLAANNDIVPADLSALKPYFDTPVTDDMLARYKLLQTGTANYHDDMVTLTAYADDQYDSNHGMSINGAWGGGFNHVRDAVNSAIQAFQSANIGQTPTDPSQLQAYLQQPIEAVTVQKYLDLSTANPPSPTMATITPVLQAYLAANNGQSPPNPADVLPYITTPEQMAAFEKLEPDVAALAPALNAYSAANNGQLPKTPTDVLPYLTTPGQKAAYQRLTGKSK